MPKLVFPVAKACWRGRDKKIALSRHQRADCDNPQGRIGRWFPSAEEACA